MRMKILDADQEIWFDEKQAPPSPDVFIMACVPNNFTKKFYWKLWGCLTKKEFDEIRSHIEEKVRNTDGFKLSYLVKVFKSK